LYKLNDKCSNKSIKAWRSKINKPPWWRNVTGTELAASRKKEKYASIWSDYLFAPIAVETLGPMNTSACQLCQSGKKDLLGVRQWQWRSFSVPESFGAGATLQHCVVTWHLASPWLHGLMICTRFCIILIFKLPREHIYRGLKNNNSSNSLICGI